MKKLAFILSLFCIQASFSQKIEWSKTSDWKLYEIHDDNAFRYSIDTLKNFKAASLNNDSIKYFLKDATAWPKDKYASWMGLYVVTCKTAEGETRKIDVSVYGGFFYDEKAKTYYSVSEEEKDSWLHFFSETAIKL